MSESKYCRLVSVDTGDDLRVVRVDNASVYVGDMVSIDTGETGFVVAETYTKVDDDVYALVASVNHIYEATGVYRHVWTKEEPDADS